MAKNLKLSDAVLHLLKMVVVIRDNENNKRNIEIRTIGEDLETKYIDRKNDFFRIHPDLTESIFIDREIKTFKSYLDNIEGMNDYYERVLTEFLSFLESKKIEFLTNNKPLQTDQRNFLQYKESIIQLGFFDLKMLKEFNKKQKEDILYSISVNSTPYQIAMFNYLGFIKHIAKEFTFSNAKIFVEFAKILNVQERLIKGNINVLVKGSKENRTRYTSHLCIEKVETDFLNFKTACKLGVLPYFCPYMPLIFSQHYKPIKNNVMENSFNDLPETVNNLHKKLDIVLEILLSKDENLKSDKLLTVKQAAEYLSIAVSTLYGLNMKGEIPKMKTSKRCYYLETDLLEYLKNSKSKSKKELEKDIDNYINKNKRK